MFKILMYGAQKLTEEEKECQEEQDKNARLDKDVSLFQKRKKIEDDVRLLVSYPLGSWPTSEHSSNYIGFFYPNIGIRTTSLPWDRLVRRQKQKGKRWRPLKRGTGPSSS